MASWARRAGAYDKLTARWPIFSRLAGRLLEDSGAGPLLDLGAGAGLLSELALKQDPERDITLLEPAGEMHKIALARLAPRRPQVLNCSAEQLAQPQNRFESVLSSAVFHLVDETKALPRISHSLRAGGLFAFNLWWHSFDETAPLLALGLAREPLLQALSECGHPEIDLPRGPSPRLRNERELREIGLGCGLHLEQVRVDHDRVPRMFFVEFAAMSPEFIDALDSANRELVAARAIELSKEIVQVPSVRILFRKGSA